MIESATTLDEQSSTNLDLNPPPTSKLKDEELKKKKSKKTLLNKWQKAVNSTTFKNLIQTESPYAHNHSRTAKQHSGSFRYPINGEQERLKFFDRKYKGAPVFSYPMRTSTQVTLDHNNLP